MRLNRILVAVVAAVLTLPVLGADRIEKSYPFDDNEHKVGIKVGDVTIDSFRVRNWPDSDDFEKAEKDLNDTHTMVVEFTYSNRDEDHDYRCVYTVTIPGGKDGKPYLKDDFKRDLDKGKIGDTNKLWPLRMKTRHYKEAKTIQIAFEIRKK